MSRFAGKTAIVTSASRGIGFATAAALVAEGASVCITARDAEGLELAAAAMSSPDRVLPIAGDTADPAHREAAVAATMAHFGSLDLLVNNTGINAAYGPLIETEPEALRTTLDTNVVAALAWTTAAHRVWMGDNGGAVVNVTSVAGIRPASKIGAYGISKAALGLLTAQLALELGPRVRVNAVAPAIVRTQFAKALYEGREEEVSAGYPLGRLGEPDDVAGAIAFLLSEDAGWISGETIVLDGGQMTTGGVDG
jgi:NAD(P)-dependent dehydrogenase (short-subunit alcohol dehydrogenase family)